MRDNSNLKDSKMYKAKYAAIKRWKVGFTSHLILEKWATITMKCKLYKEKGNDSKMGKKKNIFT